MTEVEKNQEKFDHKTDAEIEYRAEKGLSEELVRKISEQKDEPGWMTERRVRAYRHFKQRPMPDWGPDLSELDVDDIVPFMVADADQTDEWEEVPDEIQETFDKLGIPEAEKEALSGVGAQYESQVVYQNMKEEWEEKGVVFCDMDKAVQEHEDLVREHFMNRCVPPQDNKFAALHGALWSGGSFVHVPEGVEVEIPVQAYFRMNSKGMGQFEHTLIVAEESSTVHYIEGCHPEGTMVETVSGEKPIESIEKGELVLTHEGRFKQVKETQQRKHKGHIYDIEFWGDSTRNLTLTPGHPVLISRRERDRESNWNWNTQWTEAKDVNEKDYVVIPRRKFGDSDSVDFNIKKWDNTEKEFNQVERSFPAETGFFRLIGYYLAEGSNSGGHYLNLSFNSDEEELLRDAESLIEEYLGKSPDRYPHKSNNGTTLRLNSTDAVRIFEEFGERAGDKEIPEWIYDYSRENIEALLEGFFAGDGNWYSEECKHGDKSLYRFSTVSEQLASRTRKLLLDLGIGSFINVRERDEPRQPMFTVGIAGQHMEKFADRILEIELEDEKRRQSKIHVKEERIFVPVRNIRKRSTEEKVYNLKVKDDESYVSEGITVHNCSAPQYTRSNLHAGCVEVFVKENAHVQYSTVQNWSKNTYNLNTKRAKVSEEGTMEWVSGSMGSKVTMLYPSSHLNGRGARANHITIAYAGQDQDIDTGAKVVHNAPETKSTIESKSISQDNGRTNYRGLVRVAEGAEDSKTSIECDAMMFDEEATSDTEPYIEIKEDDVEVAHEATVGRIGDDEIHYLMSRGIEEEEAKEMIVRGFIEPIAKELPLEYAVELNRLIQLEMEGSLG